MTDINHEHPHENSTENRPENKSELPSNPGLPYWQTIEHYDAKQSNDPEFQNFVETEFLSSPLREDSLQAGDKDGGVARREFLKLMGASLAMASASCIRRPAQKIVPYNKAPEEVTFGIPNYYTSTYYDGTEAVGVVVKTREGRPIKVEGNPSHPLNRGGLSAAGQAHILSLYDPDRLQDPKKNLPNKERSNYDTVSTTWSDADQDIAKQLAKGGVAVLSGNIPSPSLRSLFQDFTQVTKAKYYQWEPITHDDVRDGQKQCYGSDVVPFYRFDRASLIVSVDADFLGTWLAPTTFTKQFSEGRKDMKTMSKLVMFDSRYSLTGANADVRVRIKPSQQLQVVMGLAHEIVIKKGLSKFAGNSAAKTALQPYADSSAGLAMEKALFTKIAEDLWANRGKSLIVAGGLAAQTEMTKELQIAVNFLNAVLENDGVTIDAKAHFSYARAAQKAIVELMSEMNKGAVKTLIIHRSNPGYIYGSMFREALKKVEMVICTNDRIDETGALANYILPDNHAMESWSDLEFMDGVMSLHQPTIRPMYNTRSIQLSLMTWAKALKSPSKRLNASATFYDYLRASWKDDVHSKLGKGKSFESFWDEALQTGVAGQASMMKQSAVARTFKVEALSAFKLVPTGSTAMELVLHPNIAMGDGSLANISWLQELPDPISKVCWDNYAMISHATGKKMNLTLGSIVQLNVNGKTLNLPVYLQPGIHDDVVAVPVGYGRTRAGKVGSDIGQNAFPLANINASIAVFSGQSVEIKKLPGRYRLANIAGHNMIEDMKTSKERIPRLVVEATLKEYLKDEAANNHKHHVFSLWSGHQYNGHKWGMAVDLNSCTGCSACMVACQSENNIPVVGKKYVLQGREMHWIRIDRYFVGSPENAETVFQPVMCQQCDNAPCETVCPVTATAHTDEGLNDMVYNRCVGTRYCANNCPYKVRRFNWFNYTKAQEKSLDLAYNPDVTVRSRGVMEKCTFCVHRIKAAKSVARVEKRDLKDGDIKTACEQSCPTNAITFGDMNDPNSRVSVAFKQKRAYGLLEEFNFAPAVRYLSKIRNNYEDQRHPGSSSNNGGHS